MQYDTVYTGNFYRDGKYERLSLGIRDGKIARIARSFTGERTVELSGAVFPGGIDSHVHFRDPGETEKEDFSTGTASAIYGGTTTVFDMPNNLVPIRDYEAYERKLSIVRGKSYADFGLYSLYMPGNGPLIHEESSSLKIFLGGSTNTLGVKDLGHKDRIFLNEFSKPVVFHAEDEECLRSSASEPRNLREHNLSRPERCEWKALETVRDLAINKPVAAHVSSTPPDFQFGNIVQEVTPHHLLLNDSMELGPWGKVNPPLRDRTTQESLLSSFLDGRFYMISSDHAPHTEGDKQDFEHGKSGIIGVETRLPIMLGLLSKGILPVEVYVRMTCQNPARLFELNKGRIDTGYDADFYAVDLKQVRRINQNRLHSKVTFTPFDGFEAVFPQHVVLGGNQVIENGEMIDDHFGKYIPFANKRKKDETE